MRTAVGLGTVGGSTSVTLGWQRNDVEGVGGSGVLKGCCERPEEAALQRAELEYSRQTRIV